MEGILHGNNNHKFINTPQPYNRRFIRILTFFAAIGGFLFGYDTGVISGAMLILKEQFALNLLWQEMIVSVTLGFAIVFAFIGGPLNNQFGRKIVILIASLVFTVGSILLAASQNKTMLLTGRGIVGIGIGLSSMTVPMYIAEISPAEVRGKLVIVNNIFITGGQFIASCIDGAFSNNKENGWRYMLGLAALPAIIQFIGFLFLPESPRWLIQKGKINQATRVLSKTYTHDVKIHAEIESLRQTFEEEKKFHRNQNTFFLMLANPSVRRALVVGCGLQMFQQLSGINTVMYYSATILQMSGVRDDSVAIWLAAAVAFINFICTLIGLWLVERAGRRKLTIGSIFGVTVSLLILAGGFFLSFIKSPTVDMHLNNVSTNSCNKFESCGTCMQSLNCGFCYMEDSHSNILNSTCVSADANTAKALQGRCSNNSSTPDLYFAYNYCPTSYSWIVLLGMIMYLFFFAPGMGPMPWTVNSEIYPQWCRSSAISCSTGTNWIFNLFISVTFLHVTESLTYQGAFLLYAGLSFLGFIFISCLLPETRGKPLEEIQELFSSGWLVFKKNKPSYHVILNSHTNESSDEEDPLFIR